MESLARWGSWVSLLGCRIINYNYFNTTVC